MSSLNLKNKVKIILMGTPDFSLPGFKAIQNDDFFEVIGVFTQPDKASGRKKIISAPPVKLWAQTENLPIYQPSKIKPVTELIKELAPDLILVIAYGKIIPSEILNIPSYGCINVHASLLPKYRGAACLNAPLLNGDKESGITIMKMDEGLDTGPILKQVSINLDEKETLPSLHNKLTQMSAEILPSVLKDWLAGKIKPRPQDNNQASYIGMLKKDDGLINWNLAASEIERKVRALNPWPGTFSYIKTKNNEKQIIKILETNFDNALAPSNLKVGQLYVENKKLKIKCGQNSLHILKLQIAGGKKLTDQEFLAGYKECLQQILK